MSDSPLQLPPVLTVKQLAEALDQPVTAIIAKLMGFGVLATINEDIDFDTASIVADEFGVSVEKKEEKVSAIQVKKQAATSANAQTRPAIVTIMGHVDHGKTTLLDTIRNTKVAAGEAGGITQHISSYQVDVTPRDGGASRTVTFLDTPGHSAFEAMRRHGAQITDLVVLVVAADDGIKPQTVEAINHARQMQVPILVAVNKIDKPGADLDRVKGQLAEYDLTPEDWGGKTITVPISALANQGIDDLLEMILLATDLRDLKASYEVPAVGVVIESQVRPGIGPTATVLIQNGMARIGDYIAIGAVSGRIRTMIDHRGKKVTEAGPSTPIAISGLSGLPNFGEQFAVFSSDKDARESARRYLRSQGAKRAAGATTTLQIRTQEEDGRKIMNIVVKADTIGSLEAIRTGLAKMRNDYLEVRIVSDGAGDISEGDITMAQTANANVVGFHVKLPAAVKTIADREKVSVALYSVIYELFDDIRTALSELMPLEDVEVTVGQLKVLARFRDNKKNVVLGGMVMEGTMEPKTKLRIKRGEKLIAEGVAVGVRRGRELVKTVQTGSECGLEIAITDGNAAEVKPDDMVQLYRVEQQKIPLGL